MSNIWEYSPLYKKINASFNLLKKSNPLGVFVTGVYSLWCLSKFNPFKNNVYDNSVIGFKNENEINKKFIYTRESATTFDYVSGFSLLNRDKKPLILNIDEYYLKVPEDSVDTATTLFFGFDKILICSNDVRNFYFNGPIPSLSYDNLLSWGNYIRPAISYGYYEIYQPISIVNISENNIYEHSWNDGSTEVKQNFMPAFLFQYMDEKKDKEFLYRALWNALNASYNGVKLAFKNSIIERVVEPINKTLDFIEENIDENVYEFINDFCLSYPSNDEFCKKINTLFFWIQDYQTIKTKFIKEKIYEAANDLVSYAQNSSWPNEFQSGMGINAKQFILSLSLIHNPTNRINKILLAIEVNFDEQNKRYGNIPETPINIETKRAPRFSKLKYLKIDNITVKNTGNLLHTDADVLEMINFGINLSLADDVIVGLVFKSFRA